MAHPFGYSADETLAAHRTITTAEALESNIFAFDPGGSARNLILPDPVACAGVKLDIANIADGAEVITIQDPTGPSTVCTPTQGEAAHVWSNGVIWRGGTLTAS